MKCIIDSVQRARESVGILLNDVLHGTAIDLGCVGYRTLSSNFQGLSMCGGVVWPH